MTEYETPIGEFSLENVFADNEEEAKRKFHIALKEQIEKFLDGDKYSEVVNCVWEINEHTPQR